MAIKWPNKRTPEKDLIGLGIMILILCYASYVSINNEVNEARERQRYYNDGVMDTCQRIREYNYSYYEGIVAHNICN